MKREPALSGAVPVKRLKMAAKSAGLEYSEYELTNHTGVRVGGTASTLGRHSEVNDITAQEFFDQFATELGKGWWR